jgi:PAS domain S-box-containing protein
VAGWGRHRCFILFVLAGVGLDKGGGLLADSARLASTLVAQMKRELIGRFYHLLALWIAGSVALGLATAACFLLGLNFATTALIFLVIIVLLSLLDSFISSAVFSVVAVGCLNYFFTEPLFTLDVGDPQDITTLVAFLITSLAVTSLVRRVRRLGETHREQSRLLDLTHDPIFVRGPNDTITYWNRGAEELYGWKREEALGKVPRQLLQTVFPTPLEQITETLHSTGRWEGELQHTKRDGTQVIVASRWSLQRTDSGYPLGTLETNNNITDRKRAEEALRRTQETYLAEAQQLSQTGSFGWYASTGETFWSEESFRIFGYDKSVKPSIALIFQRVHPDDAALVRQIIDRATHDQQDFDFEHRLMMPDGSVKHLHVVAHANGHVATRRAWPRGIVQWPACRRRDGPGHLPGSGSGFLASPHGRSHCGGGERTRDQDVWRAGSMPAAGTEQIFLAKKARYISTRNGVEVPRTADVSGRNQVCHA